MKLTDKIYATFKERRKEIRQEVPEEVGDFDPRLVELCQWLDGRLDKAGFTRNIDGLQCVNYDEGTIY